MVLSLISFLAAAPPASICSTFWALRDTLCCRSLVVWLARAEVFQTNLLITRLWRRRALSTFILWFGAEGSRLLRRSNILAVLVAGRSPAGEACLAQSIALATTKLLAILARVNGLAQSSHVSLFPATLAFAGVLCLGLRPLERFRFFLWRGSSCGGWCASRRHWSFCSERHWWSFLLIKLVEIRKVVVVVWEVFQRVLVRVETSLIVEADIICVLLPLVNTILIICMVNFVYGLIMERMLKRFKMFK